MFVSDKWKDYELIDASDGERLERWGKYILIRPDPQIIWKGKKTSPLWKKADAIYRRESTGGGKWVKCNVPESWNVSYGNLKFLIKPMGFKHTGLFPEQAVNWDWFSKILSDNGGGRVLNLFAYTGGATVAASSAGADVCHVDASKGMTAQAKQNAVLSGVDKNFIRYIVDDCMKFIEREIRRGNSYEGIIMDPPSYGRGPGGEVWKLEECVDELIFKASQLLSEKPLFFLVNSYTTGLSPSAVGYMLNTGIKKKLGGKVDCDEVGLPVTQTGVCLPCGSACRWYK